MTGTASTTTTPATSSPTTAYYLVESSGAVHGYAGARVFGSQASGLTATAVVGAASLPGGSGYWLLDAAGDLFSFGDAVSYGPPSTGRHLGAFVGIAATPDGQGFWATTAGGSVLSYGDAPFCGSPVHRQLAGSVVALVATPDGDGYWVATSGGQVFGYGDARTYGSGPGPAGSPLVGMASSADGAGYWLAYADGAVRQFGDAPFYGSAAHLAHTAAVVSIAATRNGTGYWLATGNGQIFHFGQAAFHGSLLASSDPPKPPDSVVAVVPTTAVVTTSPTTASTGRSSTTTSPSKSTTAPTTTLPKVTPLKGDPFVHGAIGYDVSDFQCRKGHPAQAQAGLPTKTGLAVLQVAGWLDSSLNSCLAAEQGWADRAAKRGDPPSLYLFVNSPTTSAASARQDASGPAGVCARVARRNRASCRAYNYGYNGAVQALAYASSRGVASSLWWLDVENAALAPGEYSSFGSGHYWSANRSLNDRTIQGAIDALRRQRITVGIYSSSIQYAAIAGDYVPSGRRLPLWVAGVPWTKPPYSQRGLPGPAVLAAWCAGTARYRGSKRRDLFAGGVPWLLQETPGVLPSPYGIDPDYAC